MSEFWGQLPSQYGRLPNPSEVDIRHIAHNLASMPRYLCGTVRPYSVGEHSLIVSYLLPDHLAFQGLMHDASEAYALDIPRFIKHRDDMQGYRDFEDHVWATLIVPNFPNLPIKLDERVKEIDTQVCALESASLRTGAISSVIKLGHDGTGDYHKRVKEAFLVRFYELYPHAVTRTS